MSVARPNRAKISSKFWSKAARQLRAAYFAARLFWSCIARLGAGDALNAQSAADWYLSPAGIARGGESPADWRPFEAEGAIWIPTSRRRSHKSD